MTLFKNILLLFFILLTILLNVSSLSKEKTLHFKLRDSFFRCFGLSQRWGLFAPNPRQINSYVALVGELENGLMINLKTNEEFLPSNVFPPPRPIPGFNHLSYNLGYLGTFLYITPFQEFGNSLVKDISNYESAKWQKNSVFKLKKIHFLQITVKTKSPGIFEPLEITPLREIIIS